MSENFKLNIDEDFCIFGINWRVINNCNHFYISFIDSALNKIKLAEIVDNDFLLYLEKILIQNAPNHEKVKYHVILNIPLQSFEKKAINLLQKFDFLNSYKILIDHKVFDNSKLKKRISTKNLNLSDHNEFDDSIKELFQEETIKSNPLTTQNEYFYALSCLAALSETLQLQKYTELHHRFTLEKLNFKEFMTLDMICIKSLNLVEESHITFDNNSKNFFSSHNFTESEKFSFSRISNNVKRRESVFSILNRCCSKSGVRMLKSWILQPLQDIDEINKRLDITDLFVKDNHFRKQIRELYLSKIPDIQTINFSFSKFLSKKDFNLINLEKLSQLKLGLSLVRELVEYLKYYDGEHKDLMKSWYIQNLCLILAKTEKLEELLNKSIVFDTNLREWIINNELNSDLFELRRSIDSKFEEINDIKIKLENEFSKSIKIYLEENANVGWVFYLNKTEGEKFIKNNKDFGFNLVNTNRAHVVLNNKKMESLSFQIKELRADYNLKEQVFHKKIIEVSASYQPVLERMIYFLSELDVLIGFSTMIIDSSFTYVRPLIYNSQKDSNEIFNYNDYNQNGKNINCSQNPKEKFFLKNSRHLILEWNQDILQKHNPLNKNLIENDCCFSEDTKIKLITGMNMGGKSTYLKQIGICVILAHIGCFVPCEKAIIPLIDQIFTRMGAGDNPLKGISTFMNEMIEVSSMLNCATENSLLLVDEIGRGTSSDNGIGLSYGILKYISNKLKCFCLFATHFFELTKMSSDFKYIKNFSTQHTLVETGEIHMEYKILPGIGQSSFGLNLMKLMKFDNRTIELLEKIKKEQEEENY